MNLHSATPLLQSFALGDVQERRHTPRWNHASYLYSLMRTDELRVTLAKAQQVLRRFDFDAIAFRGNSGALIGPPLALALDKTMLMVRKPCTCGGGSCHSYRSVEGDMAAKTYVIVDDIISSGDTVRAIVAAIKSVAPAARCIGVLETDRLERFLANPFRPLADEPSLLMGY